MPLNAGDILFTSLITDDTGSGGSTIDSSFSFVATTTIAAGEVITFHEPTNGGSASFTYTVGANGLDPGDFVRIQVNEFGAPTFIGTDPSGLGGALSGISLSGTATFFDLTSGSNIIAGSGTIAIAAHTNDDSNGALDDVLSTGLDASGIGAAAVDLDQASTTDDNAIWVGGDFTTAEIGTPANWVYTSIPVDHSTGAIGSTTYTTQDDNTPCFAPGTLIATDAGEVMVETLKIGDKVRTAEGKLVSVIWIGRHTAVKTFARERMEPVRFRAGSLGDGLPHSDLIVTQDHGMVLDGMVVNASALVNGDTIDFIALNRLPERVMYYHIETEAHDVILANGATSETYVDIPNRKVFDNYAEYLELFGEERRVPEMRNYRITSQRLLPNALKARLGIVDEDRIDLSAIA